jgi:hypothetical protein
MLQGACNCAKKKEKNQKCTKKFSIKKKPWSTQLCEPKIFFLPFSRKDESFL